MLHLTPEEKARFEVHVSDLKARSGRIVETVAARVPGTTVKDEGWAWTIQVEGRGKCLLRRDGTWMSVTPRGVGNPEFVTYAEEAQDDQIIGDIVDIIGLFPAAPVVVVAAPMPPPPKRRGVRKSEVERLKAEEEVFRRYRV